MMISGRGSKQRAPNTCKTVDIDENGSQTHSPLSSLHLLTNSNSNSNSNSPPKSEQSINQSISTATLETKNAVLFSLPYIPPPLSTKSRFLSNPLTPHLSLSSSSHHFNPLRLSVNQQKFRQIQNKNQPPRSVIVSYSSSSILSPGYLQWAAAVSAAILMLVKGGAVNKAYVVPLFALQAPASIISWMKGKYGAWTAFLALLIRLFFFLPGELELPFIALVMVIVAPADAMNLRGTQGGTIISLVIAAYLAFQHFSGTGSLRKAFDRNSIVATLAIVCLTLVPILLLI